LQALVVYPGSNVPSISTSGQSKAGKGCRVALGSQENDHIREQKAGHGINPNRKPETRCEDWM